MKVFTVGLDQKPPLEKSPESPPPGYPGGEKTHHAIPMGPETPAPPIFIKTKKGYKGVLVCMLAVFLIGLFALTLSEIAYNRQRDENFFRLRWAELKHKMGYEYANAAAERIYTLRRDHGLEERPIIPENLQSPTTTTTSTTVKTPVVDSSSEMNDADSATSMNDRLGFFKKLLEGIKKHAEEMGFDGTMQVSVLQVDPEQLRERLQQQLQNRESDESSASASNMDGFGEWAMPQQQQQQNENNNRFGVFRFDNDDYSGGDFEHQQQQQRFRGFNNQWQIPTFDHWNRAETPFFPPRPFWWQQQQQQQQQRPQTPFFFQQGPMPQQPQVPQQPQQSFIQNEMFPQQPQNQQQQQPQVIFFPNHNINQFQLQQQQQQQQQQLPEMFQHPRENAFIAPEDRIQIEPPTTLEQLNRWRMNNQKPFDFKSNEGPRGWTHQENNANNANDAFVQAPILQHQQQPAVMAPIRVGPSFAIPQPNSLPVNGVPEEPKKWENSQPLPAISIDSVSEPLPSWAIENSLESETPFAEIPQEEDLSHELSQNSITGDSASAPIPRPPSIQPEEEQSHLHILPIKEVEGEKAAAAASAEEVKIPEDQEKSTAINDEPQPPIAKEPEPIEVDFPAVKFPMSDDIDTTKHREPLFFQVDDPHPSQFEQ